MTLRPIRTPFVLALVPFFLLACQSSSETISEAPPRRGATPTPIVTESSRVTATVSLPFARLTAQAEAVFPRSKKGKGNGEDQCTSTFLGKICVGTKYDYTVSRGPLAVGPGPGDSVRITVPLDLRGHGGFRGTLPDILDLDAKSFRAKVEAFADLLLSMQPDWCPKAAVETGFRWIEPAKVEIIGGVWVNISGSVEGLLRDQLQAMGNQVASAISCEDVRREAQRVWSTHNIAVPIPDAEPLHVNVRPQRLGFSGIATTPAALGFALALEAEIAVASEPIDTTPLPLPTLETIPPDAGDLRLNVPVRVRYDHLEAVVTSQIVGRSLTAETPVGTATTTVHEVKVYPSDTRVVLGCRVSIDLPQRALDTSGWVYLMATPTPIDGGQAIQLDHLAFSRALDNRLWALAAPVLDRTLKQELEKVGTIDLSGPIRQIREALATELAKPLNGMAITLGVPEIRLRGIQVTRDDLTVEVQLRSDAGIALSALTD